ncbi:polynucleotide 5'-hydroxyl-kinase [Malassezia nana]|uniref:Polynucleotide 5'-hydroxyl-kinase GRC3 n=1 Tax=Malassezia nana TaxID=180528 RepID=A0AAF0EGQ3_9BASI|nr:polynucleotide 5'-hydroxyl-kinase [Malassezia nana]
MASEASRRVQLPPRSEYRIELDSNESVAIRFVPSALTGNYGDAEVFGAPLVAGTHERWYTFGNEAKFAISTWGGAEIDIIGHASTEYMADEISPFYTYGANLHLHLERARLRAREQLRTDHSLLQQLEELDVNTYKLPPSFEQDGPLDPSDPYRAAGQGPRVMVVGPASAGKSSLIKFLANYALRSPALASVKEGEEAKRRAREQDQQPSDSDDEAPEEAPSDKPLSEITGWWPMIVTLDPSEGAVPIPGCISAIPLTPTPSNSLPSPSPALPYGVTPQTTGALPPGVSTAHSVMPLSLWMGKQNVRENERHTRRMVDWLAMHVEKRMAKDMRTRMSGLLIDTPGVITADARTRYEFIQYCVRALKVDTVIVVGHDKLNLELTRIYANNPTGSAPTIVKIPRSGGAVEVDEVYQQKLHDLQIRSYFYGMPLVRPRDLGLSDESGITTTLGLDETLSGVPMLNPYSSTIPLDLLHIYRIGQDRVAPSSALPIGAERALSEMQVVKLDPANSSADLALLLHSVLALVETPSKAADENAEREYTDDELLGSSLLGFVHISDVDTNRKKLTVLSPSPGKLPSITAILGVSKMLSLR